MRMISKRRMVELGLAEDKSRIFDVEPIVEEALNIIESIDNGVEQQEVWVTLLQKGHDQEAIDIALRILKRRDKIMYLTE